MIQNNLDVNVAEDPDNLIVYGGKGKAARDWKSYNAIISSLKRMDSDDTLLVQSGKPVGIFKTHRHSPRVLIANSNIVPKWANWDNFNEFDRLGLIMYGQMTAGSWIYIGTQGILQGTYETFAAVGKKHFNSDLSGKIVVTSGLGGMGGAQPLSITMNNGIAICIDIDEHRIDRRLQTGYLNKKANNIETAIKMAEEAKINNRAISIGLLGNAVDVLNYMINENFIPDVITDQTSAHDILDGYIPNRMSLDEANDLRKTNPKKIRKRKHKNYL